MAADNSVAIKIDGLRETVARIRKADGDLVKELKDDLRQGAEIVAGAARPLAPVLTGKLRDSIRAGATQRSGIVRAGKASIPYAGVQHFGDPHRGIPPTTFLYDAADARSDEVVDRYHESVKRILSKIEGD